MPDMKSLDALFNDGVHRIQEHFPKISRDEAMTLAKRAVAPLTDGELVAAAKRLTAQDCSRSEAFNRRMRQITHHQRRLSGEDVKSFSERITLQRQMDAAVLVRYQQLLQEGRV